MLDVINYFDSILTRLYTKIFELQFRASFCSVHYTSRFFGLKYISISNRFRSRRGLWLEAVDSYFGQNFSPRVVIGDDFSISENSHIACVHSVVIGQGVLVGSNVLITDHNHGSYSDLPDACSLPSHMPKLRRLMYSSVVIGDNVFIGDNVVVLPGSRIECGSVVAANSVVRGYVQANTIVSGNPARLIKHFSDQQGYWIRTPNPHQ